MCPKSDRPFPDDDYHPHQPDAEGDHTVLLMAVAARLVPDSPEADEPILVRLVADGDRVAVLDTDGAA